MSIEIEGDDVIRIIEQFLYENNLQKTLNALKQETSIYMNLEPPSLLQDIKKGNWPSVLQQLKTVHLKPRYLIDLYTQIVLELIELKDLGAARLILRQTEPMDLLRELDSERYLELEGMLSKTVFDEMVAYSGMTRDEKRNQVATDLSKHFTKAKSGRLMELLGQAVKWQVSQGLLDLDIPLDLFQQKQLFAEKQDDALVRSVYKTMKFPKKQHAEVCTFSPNGEYFVVGTFDGFMEVWNYMSGKIRNDLVYQKENKMMCMNSCILALCISDDSEWLSSGAQDGSIMVWELVSGKKLKQFDIAHSHGVTSVAFNHEKTLVLSSSFDHTVKIHGMTSGNALKIFRGHTSFVNVAMFINNETMVMSGSSDGSVRIWDSKTSELVSSIYLQKGEVVAKGDSIPTVASIVQIPGQEKYVVCSQSTYFYLIDGQGNLINSVMVEGTADFLGCTLSGNGEFLYLASEDNSVSVINTLNYKVSDSGIIGMKHHPHSNILATYSEDGVISIWK